MKNGNIETKRWGPPRPREVKHEDKSRQPLSSGLTKREIFAMHAMQGLCTSGGEEWLTVHAPVIAVKIADALLAELENQEALK